MQTNRQLRKNHLPWFETLESRQLMASDWQNATLNCDVDSTALVEPIDALMVINAINDGGIRDLPARPANSTAPLIDVNGDSRLEPIDALLVINALNKYNVPITLEASISTNSDPNQNGVVLQEQVQFAGRSLPDTHLQAIVVGQSSPVSATANASGDFTISINVSAGLQTIRLTTMDDRGRKESMELLVRRGDLVHDWNTTALNVIRAWTTTSNDPFPGRIVTSPPPRVARNLAMIHAAMFDAANAVQQAFQSYLVNMTPQTGASEPAAAASAAYQVAKSLYGSPKELLVWESTLQESLRTIPDSAAKTQGIALGEQVATAILAARADDGSTATSNYQPIDQPGHWNRTQPDEIPPLLPQWKNVTPFAMQSPSQFRPAAPPALNSPEYAAAVDEVMKIGSLSSSLRSDEQTRIAQFWADGGGTITPPGHWNQITTDLTMNRSQSIVERTRTFALLNLAMSDAGIVAWDAKYTYDLWRPIDAIREADTDGNSATQFDRNWQPLLVKTPPFPAYTSGHSTFSAAAASILSGLFGTNTAFTAFLDSQSGASQRVLPNNSAYVRHFANFQQAAEEAGLSRIYGGIHFAFDNTAGLQSGDQLGDYVLANKLLPKT